MFDDYYHDACNTFGSLPEAFRIMFVRGIVINGNVELARKFKRYAPQCDNVHSNAYTVSLNFVRALYVHAFLHSTRACCGVGPFNMNSVGLLAIKMHFLNRARVIQSKLVCIRENLIAFGHSSEYE